MTAEVYVSGFGVFSAFGFGPQALLDGVLSGTPAFRPVTRFDVSHCRTGRAATFPGRDAGSSHAVPGLDAVEIAAGCGRQAIAMAGWRNPAELPVVLATPLRALSAEPESAAEKTERLGDQLGLGWPRVRSSTLAAPRRTRSSTERDWSGLVSARLCWSAGCSLSIGTHSTSSTPRRGSPPTGSCVRSTRTVKGSFSVTGARC